MEEKRKQEKYEAMHRQDCNVKERQRYHNAKEWHRQEVMTREKPQDERKQWKQHVREIERERSLEAIAACNMKLQSRVHTHQKQPKLSPDLGHRTEARSSVKGHVGEEARDPSKTRHHLMGAGGHTRAKGDNRRTQVMAAGGRTGPVSREHHVEDKSKDDLAKECEARARAAEAALDGMSWHASRTWMVYWAFEQQSR